MTTHRYQEILENVKNNPLYRKEESKEYIITEHEPSSLAGYIPEHDYSGRWFLNSSLSKSMDKVSSER